jgi:predicted RNase H-like nuclease (RuvC/YqgF family)
MTLYYGGSMGEKEIENLTKVLRDTEKDLRYYISENGNLRVENKELKEEVQKLKNENTKLGIEKIKVEYEKEIERLKLELKETKEKITLQTRTREISDKQVKEIKELRASGLSYREIEEKTKWSKFTIGRVLKGEYDK